MSRSVETATVVQVHPDAAEFIHERGGRVYVWVDDDGLDHVRTEPPARGGDWTRYRDAGVEVSIDESAGAATTWTIMLRHLPWTRLDIASDLTMSGNTGAAPPGVLR